MYCGRIYSFIFVLFGYAPVRRVMLNDKPITDWKVRHAEIVKGGELMFEMDTEYIPIEAWC